MILAVDVYYTVMKAKSVGVLFENWSDTKPIEIITSYTENPLEYEPGYFYKRELPCILELLKHTDLSKIDIIVVDGYVFLGNKRKPGLGHYLYTSLEGKIPVIGVAKTAFHNNEACVQEIYRGKSGKPLYISSIGIGLQNATECIKKNVW